MNDEPYNSFIKKQLEENEDSFFSDLEQNKNRNWNLIEYRLEKKKIIPLWFYSVAASIILLFGIGFWFNYKIELKNKNIALLNNRIIELKQENSKEVIKFIERTDTIELTKDKLVYVPIIKHNTIVKYDTVFRQIIQTDTVYLRENLPELIAEDENLNNFINNQTVNSNVQLKAKKKRRFVFRFGRPENSTKHEYRSKSQTLISLKTELK